MRSIDSKHSGQKMMGSSNHADIMLRIVCVIDFSVEFFIRTSFVGKVTDKHDKHHDSEGPNISSLSSILLFLDDFRCHIARCSTKDFDLDNNIGTLVPFSMQVLNPKSISLICIYPSIMMFYSLISR